MNRFLLVILVCLACARAYSTVPARLGAGASSPAYSLSARGSSGDLETGCTELKKALQSQTLSLEAIASLGALYLPCKEAGVPMTKASKTERSKHLKQGLGAKGSMHDLWLAVMTGSLKEDTSAKVVKAVKAKLNKDLSHMASVAEGAEILVILAAPEGKFVGGVLQDVFSESVAVDGRVLLGCALLGDSCMSTVSPKDLSTLALLFVETNDVAGALALRGLVEALTVEENVVSLTNLFGGVATRKVVGSASKGVTLKGMEVQGTVSGPIQLQLDDKTVVSVEPVRERTLGLNKPIKVSSVVGAKKGAKRVLVASSDKGETLFGCCYCSCLL